MRKNHQSDIFQDNGYGLQLLKYAFFTLSYKKYEISHIIVAMNMLLFNIVNGGTEII